MVEDDLEMRRMILDLLEDEGYFVRGAACVGDALKLADKTPFNLVVTDVRMPGTDGVDGYVLLKRRLPDLRCIVMTGYSDFAPKELAVTVGVSGYLYKPFSLDELINLVDQVVNDKKWALFYTNIIQNGPLRAFCSIYKAFKKDLLTEVNEARARVFEALFIAIASDKNPAHLHGAGRNVLPKDTANGLYYQLEQQDLAYEEYLRSPNDREAKSLIQAYQQLLERFIAFVRSGAGLTEPGRLELGQFNTLYEAIQAGRINLHDFLLAPALRLTSAASLRDSPELKRLKMKMWEGGDRS